MNVIPAAVRRPAASERPRRRAGGWAPWLVVCCHLLAALVSRVLLTVGDLVTAAAPALTRRPGGAAS